MKFAACRAALGPALLGGCLGLCHGQPWGWAPAQACLVLMVALADAVARSSRPSSPRAMVWLWASFSLSCALAALSGVPLSLQQANGALLLLPLAGAFAAYALGLGVAAGWLSGHLAGRPRERGVRCLVAWPALWMTLELLQGCGDYAVGWLSLGQLQAPAGPLSGLLPVGGVVLASGAMWLWAALTWLAWCQWREADSNARPWLTAALALPLACLALSQVPWTAATSEQTAVLVQPGALPVPADALAARNMERDWRSQLLALLPQHRSSLIVTPQTSTQLGRSGEAFLTQLEAALQDADSDLLLGAHAWHDSGLRSNSVIALGVSGRQRYDKQLLMPVAESLPEPVRRWLPTGLPVASHAFHRGRPEQAEMQLGGHRAAVSICYEIAFPERWREAAATAELLVNVSSDAAHPSQRTVAQALQLASVRALEFGKPVLRSSDWAGSVLVDARGHVVQQAPRDQAAVMTVQVPMRQGLTPYARWGHALVLACCVWALCILLALRSPIPVSRWPRLRAQAGQVLLAALGLVVISAGMMYLMVNSGQMVTEKIRVTNAADAAAYSAGVVEARALNYDAYLNRAIVANEISIAQMVSLASWVKYFGAAVDNIGASAGSMITMLEPGTDSSIIIATFAGAKYGLSYVGMSGEELAEWIINYGVGPIVTAHDLVIQALSASQSLVHLNLTAGLRQGQIANDIASEMDAKLKAEVVHTSHGFDGFTRQYAKSGASGDERGRLADVTMRSRDAFSRERNWTIDSADILLRKDGSLKKRGGTDLIDYDEWRAVDTLELHGRTLTCPDKWGIPHWCADIQESIGWGAVNVNAGGGDSGRGHHGNAYGENGRTAGRADSDMREPSYYYFSGLPGVRELDKLDKPAAEIATGITILVSKRHADTLTSGGAALAKPGGRLAQFNDKPAGGKLMALSRAEVFFDRISARADGKTEIGSLYNPYWRVRLVAPTAGDRAYAAAQQGGLALP